MVSLYGLGGLGFAVKVPETVACSVIKGSLRNAVTSPPYPPQNDREPEKWLYVKGSIPYTSNP